MPANQVLLPVAVTTSTHPSSPIFPPHGLNYTVYTESL